MIKIETEEQLHGIIPLSHIVSLPIIYFRMDSSSLPGRSAQSKNYRWASLLGSAIALLTLTIPPAIITYYSANNAIDTFSPMPSFTEPQTDSAVEERY
ncbi:hypothetical protein [Halothece sp. PCC 7418]|uniref:hypothetical protein n=1 Tax=Halothece sp. (strain PCC 7418) TaxID=65093 RepID=UPI0012379CFB|nr:hypothetical protein [Halothece sp. PCC 7418]